MKTYYVYMLANKTNSVLYTGITSNLQRRISEHKQKLVEGFTKKYNVTKLVYYEETGDVLSALTREKELKGWNREKKNKLINSVNLEWSDLSNSWW